MSSYCDFAAGHPLHGPYHDTEYGFPVEEESRLFERLMLEVNHAALAAIRTRRPLLRQRVAASERATRSHCPPSDTLTGRPGTEGCNPMYRRNSPAAAATRES